MPRPVKERKLCLQLKSAYFKPQNIPPDGLVEVLLEVDEMEAVRLADLQEEYQEDAARQMRISRQTFGNIVKRARHKIADALVNGKALRINCPRFAKGLKVFLVSLFCLSLTSSTVVAMDERSARADLSLEEFLQKVLAYYPKLKSARVDVDIALARQMKSQSGSLPALGLSAGYMLSDDPVNVFGALLRQERFTSSDNELKRMNTPRRHQDFSTGIRVEWPLFDSMQTIGRTRFSREMVKASEADEAFTRMEALLLAQGSYLNALALKKLLAVIESVETDSNNDLKKAEALQEKGMVLGPDYYAARVMLKEFTRMRNELYHQKKAAGIFLNILMGEPEGREWTLTEIIKVGGASLPNQEEMLVSAFSNRQDLQALNARLAAFTVDLSREKATALPQLNAFGEVSNNRNKILSSGGNNYIVGIKAGMSIFDPSQKGRMQEAKARKDQLEHDIQVLEDLIRQDIVDEIARYNILRENTFLFKEMADDATKAASLMAPLYSEGRKSILDLLEARRVYSQAVQDYNKALIGILMSRARLLFLSGKLDERAVKPLMEGEGI